MSLAKVTLSRLWQLKNIPYILVALEKSALVRSMETAFEKPLNIFWQFSGSTVPSSALTASTLVLSPAKLPDTNPDLMVSVPVDSSNVYGGSATVPDAARGSAIASNRNSLINFILLKFLDEVIILITYFFPPQRYEI